MNTPFNEVRSEAVTLLTVLKLLGCGTGGNMVVWSSDNTVSKVQRILDLDQDLGSFLDLDFGF